MNKLNFPGLGDVKIFALSVNIVCWGAAAIVKTVFALPY